MKDPCSAGDSRLERIICTDIRVARAFPHDRAGLGIQFYQPQTTPLESRLEAGYRGPVDPADHYGPGDPHLGYDFPGRLKDSHSPRHSEYGDPLLWPSANLHQVLELSGAFTLSPPNAM